MLFESPFPLRLISNHHDVKKIDNLLTLTLQFKNANRLVLILDHGLTV